MNNKLTAAQYDSSARLFKKEHSPQTLSKFKVVAADMVRRDPTVPTRSITGQLHGFVREMTVMGTGTAGSARVDGPSHYLVKVLITSVINHEDTSTFETECLLLLEKYPELRDKPVLFVVDGDRARWLALRRHLLKVVILICLHHLNQNVMQKMGKRIKQSAGVSETENDGENDVSQEKTYFAACRTCQKLRKIPTEWVDLSCAHHCARLCNLQCHDVPIAKENVGQYWECTDEEEEMAITGILTQEQVILIVSSYQFYNYFIFIICLAF